MARPVRPVFVLLGVLLAASACSGGGVTAWPASTTTSGATSTLPAPSTTVTSTTTSSPGELAPSTLGPAGSACCLDLSCEANTAAGAAYLQANVVGGSFGFRFMRLGGEVVASLNSEQPFYPASSVKVFLHLHAIRWVATQPERAAALATPIPVYESSCTGEGAVWTEPLESVLSAMMIESDNKRANAVLEYFGREAIAATAAEVAGTTGTRLVHRFGCGGPANDPANRSTALDLSRVFERVAREDVLDAGAFAAFTGLMLGPPWPSLTSVVADDGVTAGLAPEQVEDFLSGVRLSYKAGWWETNLSVGGLLTLPGGSCGGEAPRRYAFAVFVSEAASVAPGFDVSDVVAVVLAEEIRSALEEWADAECAP